MLPNFKRALKNGTFAKRRGKREIKRNENNTEKDFRQKTAFTSCVFRGKKEKDDPARACALPCRIGCREPETNQTGQLEEDD